MSSDLERDRSTDALLRKSLPATLAGDDSACVDAEVLAAWSDGALSSIEADQIDAHLSGCARCQAILATFARTEPIAAAAVPFWQRWPRRWLVPAAAVTGAVVIIAVVMRESPAPPVQMARQEAPSGPAMPDARPVPESSSPAPVASPKVEVETGSMASPRDVPAARPIEAPISSRERGPARAGEENQAAEGQRVSQLADRAAVAATLAAPPFPPPPPAPRQETAPTETANAGTKIDSMQVTNLPMSEYRNYQPLIVLVPGTSPDVSTAEGQRTITFTTTGQSAGVIAEIVSAPTPAFGGGAGRGGGRGGAGRGPAGANQAAESAAAATKLPATIPARWRVLSNGAIERSTNAGATWRPVAVDAPFPFTTGTSPSDLVCWLVGPGGGVLLSTDGERFARVRFPDKSDLVAVTAVDGRQATVRTTDGRVFLTSDGGSSWKGP